MATKSGNTGVVRQASRESSTGLRSDQGRRLFGDAFTVVTVLPTIPFQSLRAQDSNSKKQSGQMRLTTRELVLYSGHENMNAPYTEGVALMLSQEAQQALITWKAAGPRIIIASFRTKMRKMALNIAQCYASTNDKDEEVKDQFYDRLQSILYKLKEKDMTILMGDFDAKIGVDNRGYKEVMGRHGLGEMHENGEMFADLCESNRLVIGDPVKNNSDDQLKRWAEHFQKLLNRPAPPKRPNIPAPEADLEISCGRPSRGEIKRAIGLLNNGKASGPDGVPAEAIKADIYTSTDMLYSLLGKIWQEEVVPVDWKMGYLVKLPKKGDRRDCGNCPSIMLLSVLGKLLCRVILERLRWMISLETTKLASVEKDLVRTRLLLYELS
ncbi:uncharacterized protein [Montipora foliosa]|uniref:uncharacterized protein n=1 Tax=Montipora foliosa TaxID=591990 RepID=UPI0035F1E1B9